MEMGRTMISSGTPDYLTRPAADQQFTIENVAPGEQPRIDGLAVSY